MEDERDREEFKHVCKLCNKRYPSGKSLGGHMRSHVIANSRKNKAAQNNKVPTFVVDDDNNDNEEEDDNKIADQERENGGNSGYGLRENPKKTWRLVDSRLSKQQIQERVCKQCGKGFQSLKALCGHMSSHSEKDRNFKEEDDNSWSSESHSADNNKNNNNYDSFSSKRQTRSSMSRYRSITAVDSLGGSSSNNSEIAQQEQEDVAMCLMMLSRDSSGHKSCFNLMTAESSDNNSVILEGGSSKDLNLMSNRKKKLKQVLVDDGVEEVNVGHEEVNVGQEMDNSDSGYFENGAKELESDDSVDGFVRNCYNYGFKNPNKDDLASGLVESYHGLSKMRIRDVGNGNFGFDSPESKGNFSKKIKHDYYESDQFECVICKKSFMTHQALGGHIISHRKNGDHNSFDTSNSPKNPQSWSTTNNTTKTTMVTNYAKKVSGFKKIKGHKCPYCPKVFKSGQALGGHKRSHMIGSSSGGGSNAPVPPPEPEPKQPLIDLNLPAPVEEEASGNSQFEAW